MIHIDSENISSSYEGTISFVSSIVGNHILKYSSFGAGDIPWCWPGSDGLYIQQGANFYTVNFGLRASADDSAAMQTLLEAAVGVGQVTVARTPVSYLITFVAQTTLLWRDSRCTLNQIYNNKKVSESGLVFVLDGDSIENNPDLLEFHIDAATTNIQSGRGDISGDVLISRTAQIENKLTFTDTKSMSISVQRLNAQTTCPTMEKWNLLFVKQ